MSAKTDYSTNVERRRLEAETDEAIAKAWSSGRKDHDRYISSLKTVDINDVVRTDYSSNEIKMYPRKIIFPSKFGPEFEVVADFSGGYLRIQKKGTRIFLKLDGTEVKRTTTRSMYQQTHFRIKKQGESK